MERVIGPNGEVRPEDVNEQAHTVVRILTGETTEDEVKRDFEERDEEAQGN